MLEGKKVRLRALEAEDIDLLYAWENDTSLWVVSNTHTPYSKYVLQRYLEVSHHDIYTTKQLRLVIETTEGTTVGLIDLFDFEPFHLRAGVGIVVHQDFENRGYATEAIQLLKSYVKESLGLYQLYCSIQTENTKSLTLFQKMDFTISGTKRDWLRVNGKWQDEVFLQCVL